MASWEDCRARHERLRWVREEVLGLRSLRDTERFLRELPVAAQPEDLSWNSVNRYEKGERVPKIDYVDVLCREAGVSLAWVVRGEGTPWDEPTGAASRKLAVIRRIVSLPAPDADAVRVAGEVERVLAALEAAARDAAEGAGRAG